MESQSLSQFMNDPWQSYESKGKGKGPPHPIVPEPSTYGLMFVGLCLLVLIVKRLNK